MANPVFTPGDLVVSVYGDGDGSGTYGDNQASPIVLEQIDPTTGALVPITGVTNGTLVNGKIVLPQSSSGANNAISGEYGSSSEGSLQLSTDGHSLTIAGYGVNAATYNSDEAGVTNSKGAGGLYGNNALAQTYSVPTGGTNGAPSGVTVVPRVVADIGADGTVDTSTSLINVFNENNPRSVVTTNGSSFYLSGQGKKNDTTEGVFVAPDGASNATPTAINTATDTRTAEIYNGVLYVSADSSINPGTGNISSYGASPTGSTTPTPLPGITGTVALSNANGNSINGSSGTVDLSPENFFFANSTTLYIADGGNPKGGTAGDGGLQKWTLGGNGQWSLNYTLSAGLNLKSNATADPGAGEQGTTGLIGLTGTVNANGTVSLYATNATIGDLDQTYLYGITDNLAATTASAVSSESFTTLATAAPDTNIRGLAFAPQVAPCYCTGTQLRVARNHQLVDVAVEHLAVGDVAVTSDGAHRPITWIGHRTVDCRNHPRPHETLPVRIAAHAFGLNRPARDLFVSPGHAICVNILGEVLIPAIALVNGATIRQIDVDAITYWHVELESHDVLLAENLPAESYLDMGNRGFFAEGDVVGLTASPDVDASQRTHADFCRPVHTAGPLVEVVRAQLRRHAESGAWSLASDLRLHLEVDGRRLDAIVRDLTARFLVPADAKDVWLVSPTARPCDTQDSSDSRDLGLAVGGLRLDDGFAARDVAIDDPLLCVGFHEVEAGGRRWTSGRARLPAALWAGYDDDFFLRIDLAGTPVPRWTAPAADRPSLALVG